MKSSGEIISYLAAPSRVAIYVSEKLGVLDSVLNYSGLLGFKAPIKSVISPIFDCSISFTASIIVLFGTLTLLASAEVVSLSCSLGDFAS